VSDNVVITVYNVYVCIFLVKLVKVFFSLFSLKPWLHVQLIAMQFVAGVLK